MSTPFQNRVVGTIIVAAVAIIFLPDLLDGDKKTYQEAFEKIPSSPNIDFKADGKIFPKEKFTNLPSEIVVNEIAIDDISAEPGDNTVSEESNNDKGKEVTKTNVFPKDASFEKEKNTANSNRNKRSKALPEKAKVNTAWVIQLGSFRHKKNVEELVNKLKTNGFTVFTRPIKTKKGSLTKVFVGPELIKSSLEKKIPALKALTNVQGKVARFKPTS